MYRHKFIPALVVLTALIIACSRQSSPTAPSSAAPATTNAEDPITLKASAPKPLSPVNDAKVDTTTPVLAIERATALYDTAAVFEYRFQLMDEAGVVVHDSGAQYDMTSYALPESLTLDYEKRYTWRARAESNRASGPWTNSVAGSPVSSFVTPAGAYLRGSELRDPLQNGKTLGRLSGAVTFNSFGARLENQSSYIEWVLPQNLTAGEFSAEMTNIGNGSEEWKTKVLSMMQGDGVNITDNEYRLTLDKRTGWAGQGSRIRYTVRSGGDSIEPAGGPQSWVRSQIYLWKYEWGNNRARLRVYEGGKNGRLMEDLSGNYKGTYRPNPHVIRLGSVGGRGGDDTNPGTTFRNVWVSANPRPIFSPEAQ